MFAGRTYVAIALAGLLVCAIGDQARAAAIEKVARIGDLVPGRETVPGIAFRGRSFQPSGPGTFTKPSINGVGEAVFRGVSSRAFSPTNTAIGLYVKRPGQPLSVLVDSTTDAMGDPTFAVPGQPAGSLFSDFKSPIINDNGDVVFHATFSGGTGLYATTVTGGPIVKLVDRTDAVPGQAGVFFKGFEFTLGSTSSLIFVASMDNSGNVVFLGRFNIVGQQFEDQALYATTVAGGPLTLIADSTETMPISNRAGFVLSGVQSEEAAFTETGQVAFRGTARVGTQFFQGIFSVPLNASASPTAVAMRFDAVPDASLGGFFGGYDINDNGTVVFHARHGNNTNEGLYIGDTAGGALGRIVDDLGTFAVPGKAGFGFKSFQHAAINNAGQLGLFGQDDDAVTQDRGIYAADTSGTPLGLVANSTIIPPSRSAPALLRSFGGGDFKSASINESGNMAFSATGPSETGGGLAGLYFYNACTQSIELIMDDLSEAANPDIGTIDTASGNGVLLIYDGTEIRAGHYRSLNDANQVAFLASFGTFDSGVYIADVGATGGGTPEITCPPDAINLACTADTGSASLGDATATDSCTGASILAVSSDSIAASCGNTTTITRTWSATDASGASVTCDQVITTVDTDAPALSLPVDATVECDADSSAAATGSASATDDCDAVVDISSSDSVAAGACPADSVITRTWTGVDDCGNSVSADQTITVMDTTAPVVTVPPDATLACTDDSSPAGTGFATASDNCAVSAGMSFSDVVVAGACPADSVITRTWTATDDCGNASNANQIITVSDTVAPVLTIPADAVVSCEDDLSPAATGLATATDDCDAAPAVSSNDTVVAGICAGESVITRTWTATDACGNSVSAAQVITVVDATAPTVSTPADAALSCDATDTSPTATGSATAADNCDAAPAIGFGDVTVGGACVNDSVITRTWTATDACGNVGSSNQVISITDATAPVVSCPADVAGLDCGSDTSSSATGVATATDNCGPAALASADASLAGCGLTETITRTWTATDACGNAADCVQTIQTVDNTPPVLTVDVTPISVVDSDCSGSEVATLPAATADDACDGPLAVVDDAPAGGFLAGSTTSVTFSATDDCGNTTAESVDVDVEHGAWISVKAVRFVIGFGHHPFVTRERLEGETIVVFDNSPGSCARAELANYYYILHWAIPSIFANCTPDTTGITDANGRVTIDVPPGDYVVGLHFDSDDDGYPDQFLSQRVNNLSCGQVKRARLFTVRLANNRRYACRWNRWSGSELYVIEPEEVIWDETEQLYPFVFDAEGDWDVSVSVQPPDGFVSDYDSLSEDVSNDTEAVQFTITELGSDLVPTKADFTIRHNGNVYRHRSEIGIRLTPEYARQRGFDPVKLRERGLIVEKNHQRTERSRRSK